MAGTEKLPVKLKLSFQAQLLLREEHPQAIDYLSPIPGTDNEYLFEHFVHHYQGIGRFVLGLIDQVEVLETEEFKRYLNGRLAFERF